MVRPRAISGRLPALLNFTIYANPATIMAEARSTAAPPHTVLIGFSGSYL